MESAKARAIADLKNPAGTFVICDTAQLGLGPAGGASQRSSQAPTVNNIEEWTRCIRDDGNPYTDWQVNAPTGFEPTGVGGWRRSDQVIYNNGWGTYGDDHRRPVPRHSGGMNVIYADGHAKWSKITQFLGIPDNGVAGDDPMLGWPYGSPNNTWDDK